MDQLRALIETWRAEGARIQAFHATMGTGYLVCADALEAALAAAPPCRFMRPFRDTTCAEEHPGDQANWCGACLLWTLARDKPPPE